MAMPSSSSNDNQQQLTFKQEKTYMKNITRFAFVVTLLALFTGATFGFVTGGGTQTSSMFQGPKANTGTVTYSYQNGKSVLRVSSDFKVPDTPAPTWRVVDSQGQIYTLEAFKVNGGEKREVLVPAYIKDIARVQVYCAWAQVLLGEASFSTPVK
jgi:hypothetical protein